jgi:hypothetical protein
MAVLGPSLPADLRLEAVPPFEVVAVEPDPEGTPCPAAFRGGLTVDAIDDGHAVPAQFLGHAPSNHWEELLEVYARERGWGSALVAGYLAAALHVPSFLRVNTARALVDFGALPGVSAPGAPPGLRRAIRAPFDRWLTPLQQQDLLTGHYDVVARGFDRYLASARIAISVQTRDEHDEHGRRQPAIGILSRAHVPTLPPGFAGASAVDPTFPYELLESTADRSLRARIAETLETGGHHVVENYPHLAPEGAYPARMIVKHFFWRVWSAFERIHPAEPRAAGPSPRERVWNMLLDVEQRSGDAELLRGYLHRLQRPPRDLEVDFAAARGEYARIADFVAAHRDALVDGFCRTPDRISVLVVQLRKDLIWNAVEGPLGSPRPESARSIARAVAGAVAAYIEEDLEGAVPSEISASVGRG